MTPVTQRGAPVDPNELLSDQELMEFIRQIEYYPSTPPNPQELSTELEPIESYPFSVQTMEMEIESPPSFPPSIMAAISRLIAQARQRLQARDRLTLSVESTSRPKRRVNFDEPQPTQTMEDSLRSRNRQRLRRLQMINTQLRRRVRQRRLALERLRHLIQNQRNEDMLMERDARIRQENLVRILQNEDPEHPGVTK